MVIQMVLREADRDGVPDNLVSVADEGFEAQADWGTLGSPETYLGYEQGQNFVSADAAEFDEPREFGVPERLERNQWALSGNWTLRPGKSVANEADGRLAFRFHAPDVNLVMGPPASGPVAYPCSSTKSLPAMRTGSTSTKGATEPSISRGFTS
jgi:hypothetical protein